MGLDNPLHIAFLVVILLLVFGAKRLPEIGRSLGAGMREFKDSITGERPDANKQPALTQTTQQPPQPQQPPAPAASQAPAAQPAQPAPDAAVQAPAEPTRQA